jgi:hypothetical protein
VKGMPLPAGLSLIYKLAVTSFVVILGALYLTTVDVFVIAIFITLRCLQM